MVLKMSGMFSSLTIKNSRKMPEYKPIKTKMKFSQKPVTKGVLTYHVSIDTTEDYWICELNFSAN